MYGMLHNLIPHAFCNDFHESHSLSTYLIVIDRFTDLSHHKADNAYRSIAGNLQSSMTRYDYDTNTEH